MKVSIDKAGRLVIPKELRDQAGITAGKVDIVLEGAGLRIELEPGRQQLVEEDGWVLSGGDEEPDPRLTVDYIRELRLADQK